MSRVLVMMSLVSVALPGCAVEEISAPEQESTVETAILGAPHGVVAEGRGRVPPPTCDDRPYADYDSTTTSQDDQVYQTCNGTNVLGQNITCSDYQECTRTDTWHHSFICMNNGEFWVENTSLANSVLTCTSSFYTECPAIFFQVGSCW